MKVPEELEKAQIPRQVHFAEAAKHPQVGLEQGKQTLRSILVHLAAGIFLLGVIDELVHVALQSPIAAGRVRAEPTAGLHRDVSRLLHRLDGEISGRVEDDSALAAYPRDDRRSIFIIMTPGRAHASCVDPGVGDPDVFCHPAWLGPSGQRCDRVHLLPPCLPTGGRFHRRWQYCAVTNTSDSSYGYGPLNA